MNSKEEKDKPQYPSSLSVTRSAESVNLGNDYYEPNSQEHLSSSSEVYSDTSNLGSATEQASPFARSVWVSETDHTQPKPFKPVFPHPEDSDAANILELWKEPTEDVGLSGDITQRRTSSQSEDIKEKLQRSTSRQASQFRFSFFRGPSRRMREKDLKPESMAKATSFARPISARAKAINRIPSVAPRTGLSWNDASPHSSSSVLTPHEELDSPRNVLFRQLRQADVERQSLEELHAPGFRHSKKAPKDVSQVILSGRPSQRSSLASSDSSDWTTERKSKLDMAPGHLEAPRSFHSQESGSAFLPAWASSSPMLSTHSSQTQVEQGQLDSSQPKSPSNQAVPSNQRITSRASSNQKLPSNQTLPPGQTTMANHRLNSNQRVSALPAGVYLPQDMFPPLTKSRSDAEQNTMLPGLMPIAGMEGRIQNNLSRRRKQKTHTQTFKPLVTLAAFMPNILKDDFVTNEQRYSVFDERMESTGELVSASESLQPSMVQLLGAVMIADVTGFTALTELLSKRGASGVEMLTTCMNSYFRQLISYIHAYEGDVVKFAGDSMICVFKPTDEEKHSSSDNGIKSACLRAVRCGYELATKLGAMKMKSNGEVFSLHEEESAKADDGFAIVKLLSTENQAQKALGNITAGLVHTEVDGDRKDHQSLDPGAAQQSEESKAIGKDRARLPPGHGLKQPSMASRPPGMSFSAGNSRDINGHHRTRSSLSLTEELSRRSCSLAPAGSPKSLSGLSNVSSSFSAEKRGGSSASMCKALDIGGPIAEATESFCVWNNTLADEPGKNIYLSSNNAHIDKNSCTIFDEVSIRGSDILSSLPHQDMEDDELPPFKRARFEHETVGGNRNQPYPHIFGTLQRHSCRHRHDHASSKVLLECGQPIAEAREDNVAWDDKAYGRFTRMAKGAGNMVKQMFQAAKSNSSRHGQVPAEQGETSPLMPASRATLTRVTTFQHTDTPGVGVAYNKTGRNSIQLPERPYEPAKDDISNCRLALKVMVSFGTLCLFHVGGGLDEPPQGVGAGDVPRWEYFIGDCPHAPSVDDNGRRQPIAQIAAIEDHAASGTIILSKEAIGAIGDECNLEQLSDDVARVDGLMRPELVRPTRPELGEAALAVSKLAGFNKQVEEEEVEDEDGSKTEYATLPNKIKLRVASLFRMHVLSSLRRQLEAGQLDYTNEIRHLTVLFMGFPSLVEPKEGLTADKQIASVQFHMRQVQDVICRWEGSMLQFRCDEKGFLSICVFGLRAHEDNPSRGILAALEINKMMKKGPDGEEYRACIGVTTGDLFVANVGARKVRYEYTVFGDAINLSARLMVKSKKNKDFGDVLCDDTTYQRALRKAVYSPLEPMIVKGIEKPINVYSVTCFDEKPTGAGTDGVARKRGRRASVDLSCFYQKGMVGRDVELNKVLTKVDRVVEDREGGTVILEGDAGMGKSKFVAELKRHLERAHLSRDNMTGNLRYHVFMGIGDAARKSRKLSPFHRIFRDLFAADANDTVSADGFIKSQKLLLEDLTDAEENAKCTSLGTQLAHRIPHYNRTYRSYVAEILELPESSIPCGDNVVDEDTSVGALSSFLGDPTEKGASSAKVNHSTEHPLWSPEMMRSVSFSPGMHNALAGMNAAAEETSDPNRQAFMAAIEKKNSVSLLLLILQEYISLYGPIILLLEDVHHFDTSSWELIIKLAEEQTRGILCITTIRPSDGSLDRSMQGRAAVYQKVQQMYRQLKAMASTMEVPLAAFNLDQARLLMEEVGTGKVKFSNEWVRGVNEKFGGIPLYIEKVAEFLCQKQELVAGLKTDAIATIHKQLGNLSIKQIILERVDRLRPATHLTLKVASVLGQWVKLDILHEIYPLPNKSMNELRSHLLDLETRNFMKPTDDVDQWEFNSVERDTVYEVVPTYQRRRLHSSLAQVLEKRRKAAGPLTLIAYHWNMACIDSEVTELPAALKSIEFWELAAEEARFTGGIIEALRLYTKATEIADSLANQFDQIAHEWLDNPEKHDIQVNWALLSNLRRASWEKHMSLLSLAIQRMLQAEGPTNSQHNSVTETQVYSGPDYISLVAEHASQGVWLLGGPEDQPLNPAPDFETKQDGCCSCGKRSEPPSVLPDDNTPKLVPEEAEEVLELLLGLLDAASDLEKSTDVPKAVLIWKYCIKVCAYFRNLTEGSNPLIPVEKWCRQALYMHQLENSWLYNMFRRCIPGFSFLLTGRKRSMPTLESCGSKNYTRSASMQSRYATVTR